jgi:hypothetical protein
MAVHRWFEAKSCPGNYLYSIHGKIADEVNRRLAGNTPIVGLPTGVVIEGDKPSSVTTTTTSGSTRTITDKEIEVPCVKVDYSKLTPYLLTVPRSYTSKINYKKMKSSGVVGVLFEAGYLFNSAHVKVSEFMNPNLKKQVSDVTSAGLRYGLCMIARAHSVSDVHAEIEELRAVVRKYPPSLGMWLNIQLTSSVGSNDKLIAEYQKCLVSIGFKGHIGIYATPSSIKTIHWSKFKSNWLLWLNSHVKKKSDIEQLLQPEFFDMKGRYI